MIIKVVIFNSSYPCLDPFRDLLQFSALGNMRSLLNPHTCSANGERDCLRVFIRTPQIFSANDKILKINPKLFLSKN